MRFKDQLQRNLVYAFLAISALFFAPVVSQAANLGIELGTDFYPFGSDSRVDGNGNFLVINFPLSGDTEIGFFHEELSLRLDGKTAAGAKVEGHSSADLNAIRVAKSVTGPVSIVLDVGGADISNTDANGVTDTVPFADILGKVTLLSGKSDKISSDLGLTLGYRLMRISAQAPGGVSKNYKDLSGVTLSLSAAIRF